MNHHFITSKEAQNLHFIKDIVFPIIGNISSIVSCGAQACNSYAYLLDNHLIVKFAKEETQLNKLILEQNVLSFLKGKTTLQIPEMNIFENHFAFTIHEMIKGTTIQNQQYQLLSVAEKNDFCQNIAQFIYELHSLTSEIKQLNLPMLKGISSIYSIDKIKSFFETSNQLTATEKSFITQFCDNYTNITKTAPIVFGHFDIQPKNIAFNFDKKEIAGIYDFGDCGFCADYYDFIQFGIQYNFDILNNTLKYYQQISGIHYETQQIENGSIYRILYCMMRDIECHRSIENNLKSLRVKMDSY